MHSKHTPWYIHERSIAAILSHSLMQSNYLRTASNRIEQHMVRDFSVGVYKYRGCCLKILYRFLGGKRIRPRHDEDTLLFANFCRLFRCLHFS